MCKSVDVYSYIGENDFIFLQMVSPLILLTFILYPRYGQKFKVNDYLGLALELINIFDIMDMTDDLHYVNNYNQAWSVTYFLSMGMATLLISFPVQIDADDIDCKDDLISHSISASELSSANQGNLEANDTSNDKSMSRKKYGACDTEECVIINVEIQAETELNLHEDTPEEKNYVQRKINRENFRKILKALLTLVFIDILFATIRLKTMLTEQSVQHGLNMVVKNLILACLHLHYLSHMVRLYCHQAC